MKILHYIAAISFLATPIFAANSLEGEYVGKVDAKEGYFKDNPLIAAQVYREGNEYKVVIYPDLWRRAQPYVKFNANANLDKIEFDQGGWNAFKGTISKNEITGVAIYSTKEGKKSAPMKLSKIKRKSPTLGKRPPKGAINPLIDRTNLTTCAMRYPSLIGQANRPTLKRGAHKESITEVCYHNMLCMSSFYFNILCSLKNGPLSNDCIQQFWPPSFKLI